MARANNRCRKKIGLHHIGIIPLKYQTGGKMLPLDLHVFDHNGSTILTSEYIKSVKDTHGIQTLYNAVMPFAKPGKIILDPCCGMGYTAEVAIKSRMRFRGNELNMKRLEKTINRLKKCTTQH